MIRASGPGAVLTAAVELGKMVGVESGTDVGVEISAPGCSVGLGVGDVVGGAGDGVSSRVCVGGALVGIWA